MSGLQTDFYSSASSLRTSSGFPLKLCVKHACPVLIEVQSQVSNLHSDTCPNAIKRGLKQNDT